MASTISVECVDAATTKAINEAFVHVTKVIPKEFIGRFLIITKRKKKRASAKKKKTTSKGKTPAKKKKKKG